MRGLLDRRAGVNKILASAVWRFGAHHLGAWAAYGQRLGGLAIERQLIRNDGKAGPGRCCGLRFGRKPKLSDFQRKEAAARRGNGETLAQIACSYAVSVSMISRL